MLLWFKIKEKLPQLKMENQNIGVIFVKRRDILMIRARNYMKSSILLDRTFSDEFLKEFSWRSLWISNLLINGIQFLNHCVKK